MITVICPIRNEELYIEKFLNSILQQDYSVNDMEILLLDGMSTDKTRSIVDDYTKRYPHIRLIDNMMKTVSYAMNEGIRNAIGDIIIRLDAHAEYPVNYFSKLVYYLNSLKDADNVGGICVTQPANDGVEAKAIAACLSSRFGVGNSYFRIGTRNIKLVDTVPFGCFRKSLFDKIGLYDTDMVRNQDDELNGRIIKNGGKIYLLPDVEINYYSRDRISKVRKMLYEYGLYKPLGNKKLGAAITIRQFFPLFFVIGLVTGIILSLFFPILWPLFFGVVALHIFIGTIEGIKNVKKTKEIRCVFLMPYIFMNMHISYGIGYLHGIYNIAFNRSFEAKTNR